MLLELRVENLLLIEQAQLRLAPGLNVLTGETGAGKTVLAHALDLLLGGRAREGIVRPGAQEAYVEGIFELAAPVRERLGELLAEAAAGTDAAHASEIVLARRVRSDGRTRALINGRAAAVGDLRAIGGALLSFYGQHEHRKLTLAAAQLAMLDSRCGPAHARRLRECAQAFARVREIEARLEGLGELAGARERELDLLDFELAEIDAVAPEPDEYEQLLAARERLRSLDGLLGAAAGAAQCLAGEGSDAGGAAGGGETGVAPLAARAASLLTAAGDLDETLAGFAERAEALALESQELASELAGYGERAGEEREALASAAPGSAGTLDALEVRLAAIERLVRKHGGTLEALMEFARTARVRRSELADAETSAANADSELAAARAKLEEHARKLRRARRAAAAPFAAAVSEQLATLAMPGAGFEVRLQERDGGPGAAGADAVEFIVAPNPGVPGGPVREIASGGELSRIMLAILSVAGAGLDPVTLVFDEVDAGIGGHTARALGARLRELAQGTQIICITHLAQVASLAARHFAITKQTEGDSALATVRELAEQDTLGELARMLGADGDEAQARRHARELLRAA
jgi:DNA repair protein RecN (Recombination protein N)